MTVKPLTDIERLTLLRWLVQSTIAQTDIGPVTTWDRWQDLGIPVAELFDGVEPMTSPPLPPEQLNRLLQWKAWAVGALAAEGFRSRSLGPTAAQHPFERSEHQGNWTEDALRTNDSEPRARGDSNTQPSDP